MWKWTWGSLNANYYNNYGMGGRAVPMAVGWKEQRQLLQKACWKMLVASCIIPPLSSAFHAVFYFLFYFIWEKKVWCLSFMKSLHTVPPTSSDSQQTHCKHCRPDSAVHCTAQQTGSLPPRGARSFAVYILLLPTNLFILAVFAQVLLDKHRALSCKHFCSSRHTYSWHLSICWIWPLISNEWQATFSVFHLNVSREPYLRWGILEIILELVFQASLSPCLRECKIRWGGRWILSSTQNVLKASLNLVLLQSYQELCLGLDLIWINA